MSPSLRERAVGAVGSAAVLGLFGYALLTGLTFSTHLASDQTIAVLELRAPPPPPETPPPIRKPPQTPAKHAAAASGGRSAPVIRQPPSIFAPTRAVTLPNAPPAPALSPTGAGGAGGSGAGAGEGSGAGTGEGGDGGDTPPRLRHGKLKLSDLPASMRGIITAATVTVRYDVAVDGRVGACAVVATSGNADLDQRTCQLIRERFRFDPARDARGRAVQSTIEETHSWTIDRETQPAHTP